MHRNATSLCLSSVKGSIAQGLQEIRAREGWREGKFARDRGREEESEKGEREGRRHMRSLHVSTPLEQPSFECCRPPCSRNDAASTSSISCRWIRSNGLHYFISGGRSNLPPLHARTRRASISIYSARNRVDLRQALQVCNHAVRRDARRTNPRDNRSRSRAYVPRLALPPG